MDEQYVCFSCSFTFAFDVPFLQWQSICRYVLSRATIAVCLIIANLPILNDDGICCTQGQWLFRVNENNPMCLCLLNFNVCRLIPVVTIDILLLSQTQ